MSDDDQDYDDCGLEDEDDGSAEVHREEQLSFAFIPRINRCDRSNRDDSGTDDDHDRLQEYADLESHEIDLTSHPTAPADEPVAFPGPGLAIFSMVDVVEALKVSGAATSYLGWDGVLAYAKAHMAAISATTAPAAFVPASPEPSDADVVETHSSKAPTFDPGPGPSSPVYPSRPAYPDQNFFDALRAKACVACLVFDDTTFDTALTDAAGRVNVEPALAALPRGTDEAGGATAALSI